MKRIFKEALYSIMYFWGWLFCFHKFSQVGRHSKIIYPLRVVGGKQITIGDYCYILNGLRIETIEKWNGQKYIPNICIENYVSIGQNCHFTCANKIHIGKGASILPDVLITDIEHDYFPGKSIRDTGINVGGVEIGDYAVIGMGARIIGSNKINIGKNAIIGANAVVKGDIPDNAVVAGIPAKIIKFLDSTNKLG